jgi:hypothetical protein
MHQHPRVREQEMALERASQSAQEAGPLHDDHRAFGQPPVALLTRRSGASKIADETAQRQGHQPGH